MADKNILFGYSCVPSCGWEGEDDGGFSVEIYADGRLEYKTYIFSRIDKTKTEYKISENSIYAIKRFLYKYKSKIDSLDEHLDNGSCDGNGNFFNYNGKEIITWNINDVYVNKFDYICTLFKKEFCKVAEQEYIILFLFYNITKILKNDGVSLNLSEVIFFR